MGLSRLLVVALLVWVVWSLWRRWRRARARGDAQVRQAVRIVKCAQCGVYLPEGDARALGDAGFECKSHDQPAR
jgi:uncharacterized protein